MFAAFTEHLHAAYILKRTLEAFEIVKFKAIVTFILANAQKGARGKIRFTIFSNFEST